MEERQRPEQEKKAHGVAGTHTPKERPERYQCPDDRLVHTEEERATGSSKGWPGDMTRTHTEKVRHAYIDCAGSALEVHKAGLAGSGLALVLNQQVPSHPGERQQQREHQEIAAAPPSPRGGCGIVDAVVSE